MIISTCLIWKGKAGNDWHLRVSASEKDQMIFKEKDYLDCSWTTCRVCFCHKHWHGTRPKETVSRRIGDSWRFFGVVQVEWFKKSNKELLRKTWGRRFWFCLQGILPNQVEEQFRAEVTTIGAIQYINLVRLRGFCAKRLLVYDYMPYGSLQSLLRQKKSTTLRLESQISYCNRNCLMTYILDHLYKHIKLFVAILWSYSWKLAAEITWIPSLCYSCYVTLVPSTRLLRLFSYQANLLMGDQKITSPAGIFELGFSTPPGGNSHNYYIGIWYKNVPIPKPACFWSYFLNTSTSWKWKRDLK